MTTRRQFLKRTGGMLTLCVGGLQIACTMEQTKQVDAAGLTDEEILSLTRIIQHILPHPRLDTQVYVDAVMVLTDRANNSPSFKRQLQDGIAGLNASNNWLEQTDAEQIKALKNIDQDSLFRILQTTALEQVYRDERTWELVGYEGEAIKFGGYVHRGFNDIDWLPDPPGSPDTGGSD